MIVIFAYIYMLFFNCAHLSKLSSELILWSSNFMNLFNISSEYSTGSSIMPQKEIPTIRTCRSKTNSIRIKSINSQISFQTFL